MLSNDNGVFPEVSPGFRVEGVHTASKFKPAGESLLHSSEILSFTSCSLYFSLCKMGPFYREMLYRLYSLCVKCSPVEATAQRLASLRAPHKSLYIASHKVYDFVDLENPPSQGSSARTDRRHSRVWATPL